MARLHHLRRTLATHTLGIPDSRPASAAPGAAELAGANAVIVVPPADVPIPAHGDVNCWLLD